MEQYLRIVPHLPFAASADASRDGPLYQPLSYINPIVVVNSGENADSQFLQQTGRCSRCKLAAQALTAGKFEILDIRKVNGAEVGNLTCIRFWS